MKANSSILKPSRFNIAVNGPINSLVLFNGSTGAILLIPKMISGTVDSLLSSIQINASSADEVRNQLVRLLLKGGFLVSSSKDEIYSIAKRFEADITDGCLNVTVCTTLECNLACTYCYQSRESGRMSMSTANSIVSHLERELLKHKYRELDLEWFGGEPFLALNLVDHISKRLISATEHNGVDFTASVVTNGTLIPKDIDEVLIRNRIVEAQVTLDGPADIHNRNRPFKDGRASYDKVLFGVKELSSRIPVSLRINVDTNGLESPVSIIDVLEDCGLFDARYKVFPYLAPIAPLSSHCKPSCEAAMTSMMFFDYLLRFQEALLSRKPSIPLNRIINIPKPLSKACGAQSNHSLMIHPTGTVFKCGLEVHEHDQSAGMLNSAYKLHNNYRKWIEVDPLNRVECKTCAFLPVCLGGCPKYNFQTGYVHERESCVYWHHYFKRILPLIAKRKTDEDGNIFQVRNYEGQLKERA